VFDEGSFISYALNKNQDDDFVFTDQSIRKLLALHMEPEKFAHTVENLLVQKETNEKQIITTMNEISVFLFEKGELFQAIELCKLAIPHCVRYGDKEIQFKCYRRIADSHYHTDSPEEAIEYYQKALPLAIELNDKDGQALGHFNLGQSHYTINQIKDAVTHYQKALELAIETGDQHSIKSECKEYLNRLQD
jgi:tetratricopeptide (TPR) repeat protein